MSYLGLVDAGLVVVVLGVVLLGVAEVLGVTAGPFGVVVAPVDVDPGVIEVPVELVPEVELPLAPVLEDCGTADPPAGTQFAPLALADVDGAELAEELGTEVVVDAVVLGEALEVALGEVLLVEVLGVEVVVLIEPVALVLGTMPGGQLLVEDAPGVVDGLLCDEGVVEVVPACDEVVDEVEGDVVVLVVDVVCADSHAAPAVRIKSNVSFFMFSSSCIEWL